MKTKTIIQIFLFKFIYYFTTWLANDMKKSLPDVVALSALLLVVVSNVEVVPSVVEVNKFVLNRKSEVPD